MSKESDEYQVLQRTAYAVCLEEPVRTDDVLYLYAILLCNLNVGNFAQPHVPQGRTDPGLV